MKSRLSCTLLLLVVTPVASRAQSDTLRLPPEVVTATRVMDRVLRAGHYWVPHWYKASHNIAHWDKFGRPETKPKYARGVIDTWWYDPARAARLEAR